MLQLALPLHHAYCILGDRKKVAEQILRALEESAGFVARGNPDYWLLEYAVFGIDEARFIKEASMLQAIGGEKKVFLLAALNMTTEAQNALLKIFEEPTRGTHFFLILPSAHALLSTLISRMFFIDCRERELQESGEAASFLKANLPSRLKKAQSLLAETADDAAGPVRLLGFLDSLELLLQRAKREKGNIEAIEQLLLAKKYARDRSPSRKILLEHLALVLPSV